MIKHGGDSRITVVIKARNEEGQIAEAIASANLITSEVIVVDDSSSDGTVRIATEVGAKVISGIQHGGMIDKLDYQGFSMVRDGWILRMDADERITSDLARELIASVSDTKVSAVSYARLNFMFGEFVKHGGWFRPNTVGFFRADAWDKSWDCSLHSQVPIVGSIKSIDPSSAFMLHLDYLNIREFVVRSLSNYAHFEAVELKKQGKELRVIEIIFKPLRRFVGRYFLRLGFLDGFRGFWLASLLAVYDFLTLAYLWDLSREDQES